MYLQINKARTEENFGFDWFFKHADEHGDEPGVGMEGYRPVQIPHDWSIDYPFDENAATCGSGGYVKAGVGWYKKIFRVDASCRKRVNSIIFDGAYMNSKVMLNGVLLGEHAYGYTPFEFDISNILNYDGDNELTVRVDNSNQPNSRWYSGSGITRNVWIRSLNPAHIPTYGTYVTTEINSADEAKVIINVKVKASGKIKLSKASGKIAGELSITKAVSTGKTSLISTIYDKTGNEVGYNDLEFTGSGEYEQVIILPKYELWSADSPNLYKVVSVLKKSDEIIDEYETVFGIRNVEFCPDKGCLINGKQTKLHGVCLHHDGGCVGAAVPGKIWRRRLLKLKEMGCNAIRCAHNPPDPELLDLCDELGFYVMDEAFDEWALLKQKAWGSNTHESRGYSDWFNDNHVSDIEKMLYRDRNHPSVIMWSIGNEVPEQSAPDGHILAEKLQSICHRIDPTRLCTQACDQIIAEPNPATKDFLNTLDIVSYNYTPRWRTRAETLYDDDKRENPDWLILGAENHSAAGRRGDYRMTLPENYWRRPYFSAAVNVQKQLRFTLSHDYVIGDFMWTGIDYLGEAGWPDRSSSSGVLDTCGIPKDHFYFYKSIWKRNEPIVYILPHRNMNLTEGRMIPLICYTNCEQTELFVNGKSYGKKSYSYPAYGMTENYGHWDRPQFPANTDDMFLSWDVPVSPEPIEAVGYINGEEVYRYKIEHAGPPHKIEATCDTETLKSDGLDIAHIEIAMKDENNIFNPVATNQITVNIEGPAELIGLDNGMPDSHTSFKSNTMPTGGGLLLAVIRSKRETGTIKIELTSEGLDSKVLYINVE